MGSEMCIRDSIIGSSPSNSHDHHIINVVRELVGTYNHRVNQEEDLKESQVRGTLQVGDLVLARVMPHGAAKLGNKYRRNIYKIVQRTGRKLKLVAQFDNLETITLHVKNVKPFRFNHALQHLPRAITQYFLTTPRAGSTQNPLARAPNVSEPTPLSHPFSDTSTICLLYTSDAADE